MKNTSHTSASNASASHASHVSEPRPHVAALLELSELGWRVTEIRPDRTAPVLWRVTIERQDRCASITVTELGPDEALDEVLRYASVDHEATSEVVPFAPASEGPAKTSDHVIAAKTASTGPEQPGANVTSSATSERAPEEP